MTKAKLKSKPPVVVFLGHIDAGKSSILSYIQKTDLTKKESGGITQHIGAYETIYQDKKIVFIDTPGHAAFSSIRSRGAKIADMAVLVVSLDQGVLPQTKEAIAYLKETKIPVIVDINKIDQAGLPLEKVKAQLRKEGLVLESQEGKIPEVETSAKTGQGVNDLLDIILLLAEMEDLKADYQCPAEGVVLESSLDRLKGPSVKLLVNQGTLKTGDIIGTISALGRVKEILDWQGRHLDQVIPSQPAKVLGMKSVPMAGEEFKVYSSLEAAQSQIQNKKVQKSAVSPKVEETTEETTEEIAEEKTEETDEEKLKLILKADAFSSLEALQKIIEEMKEANRIEILKAEVGDINQKDVQMAESNQAQIVGFRVKTNQATLTLLKRSSVNFKSFLVIYDLLDYLKTEVKKLARKAVRQTVGRLEVLAIFWTKKKRQIVGGRIVEGELSTGLLLDVFRGAEKIGEGKIVSLERDQKKIEKVKKGQTIGLLYEGKGRIEKGDILEAYTFCFN